MFDDPAPWSSFLRNALSHGFNDDFAAFVDGGGLGPNDGEGGLWPLRRRHDYRDLLPAELGAPEQVARVKDALASIVAICGADFVLGNLADTTGNPSVARFDVNFPGATSRQNVAVNFHDLPVIYYFWQMARAARAMNGAFRTYLEIGGGFGGQATKVADAFPDVTCILLDLPEVGAVQHWYLSARFPDSRIADYADWKERGAAALADARFAILPGWVAADLPADSVDLAANVRSMMEMTPAAIGGYFDALHRLVRVGGLFFNANRYQKGSGEDVIRFKDYPYDGRWRIWLSQTSSVQPHIHEMITERTDAEQPYPVAAALKGLPPH